MQKKLLSLFLILAAFLSSLRAQPPHAPVKHTLNGYIKDASNGEALIGAAIFIKDLSSGTTTNVYGFYSITLPAGNYTMEFSYVGYTTLHEVIDLSENIRRDIELLPITKELEEVVVTA